MRSLPGLGPANLALVSICLVPIWGVEALRALMSPYGGFADRAHAAAAITVHQLFDVGFDGLMRTSNILAAAKLVIAAGFAAYLIEFARALAVGREPDRETIDVVLMLAVAAVVIWNLPALALDDPALVRRHAAQLLLVAGAVIVITVERHIEQAAAQARTAPADGVATDVARAIPGAADDASLTA